MLFWEKPATYKKHYNKHLAYHFLISTSHSVALYEVGVSLAQVDNTG